MGTIVIHLHQKNSSFQNKMEQKIAPFFEVQRNNEVGKPCSISGPGVLKCPHFYEEIMHQSHEFYLKNLQVAILLVTPFWDNEKVTRTPRLLTSNDR